MSDNFTTRTASLRTTLAQIRKLDTKEVSINGENIDSRYAQLHENNTFTALNTFEEKIDTQDGINVTGGDVLVSNGVLTFEDLVDGTVVEVDGTVVGRSVASGYQYLPGIPVTFENGVCYDIGTITNETNLRDVTFTSKTLVQTCELWFATPETVPTTHKWPLNTYWIDSATGAAPTLLANKNYRIVFRSEPNYKIIASIAYLY